MPPRLKPTAWLRFISGRLKGRKDSEHVQAIIRVVMTALVAVYLNSNLGMAPDSRALGNILSIVYFGISLCVLAWIVALPGISKFRRYSAMVGEHLFVSLGLLLEGERAAPLFLIYVWVSLGNGFRYGVTPLFCSTIISTIGFIAVILCSAFWQSVLPVSVGIVLAMIAIPLYAASLIRQLHAAKSAAEQASHSKSRFLATASHELRTPLHAIIGLSELLQQTSLSHEQLEMIHTVRSSGRALLSLVEDVLDISSTQAGRAVSQIQSFDLHEAIAETISIARPQASQKGLDLAVRVSPAIPPALQGDWPHLRQILLNLITNAIKFTDSGQVTLTVEPLAISATTVRIALAISDTGIGIAEKDLERIFDTFAQANASPTRKYGGVGLGLAIVRQLADLLNGKVSVASMPGKGSVFTVELPFTREAESVAPAARITVMVHSDDRVLLARLRDHAPEVDFIISAHEIPDECTSLIDLIDVRKTQGEIDARAREIALLHPKLAKAAIALGVDTANIDGCAPSVVTCLPQFDVYLLHPAIFLAATLAVHHEVAVVPPSEQNTIIFPVSKPNDAHLAEAARVLVVEDSPVNRMVTQKILHSAGYAVALADGADSGLELLADQEFDIVLLDLNMPGASGIDIIKLYHVMRLGMSMPPIVIFSADVTPEARAECDELGVSLFLPKPSEPWFIVQELAKLAPPMPIAAVPAESEPVVAISSHPRYRATPEFGIVDRHALQSLASLDSDRTFLSDLIVAFEDDTAELLDLIDASVRDGDMRLFWDQVHAMRSSAANVGAKQILIACSDINAQGKLSFHKRGFEYAARLRYEFNRFQRTMDRFLSAQAKVP